MLKRCLLIFMSLVCCGGMIELLSLRHLSSSNHSFFFCFFFVLSLCSDKRKPSSRSQSPESRHRTSRRKDCPRSRSQSPEPSKKEKPKADSLKASSSQYVDLDLCWWLYRWPVFVICYLFFCLCVCVCVCVCLRKQFQSDQTLCVLVCDQRVLRTRLADEEKKHMNNERE